MKKISLLRVIAAVAVLIPAISANAALFNYNQQFDSNNGGVHFNLNFTANDTGNTVITTFNGTAGTTAGTDALTLIAPGGLGGNNNLFNPSTLATTGGWDFNGVSFHGTVSGFDFNFFLSDNLYLISTRPQTNGTVKNYSYSASPVSSVPVPAAVWLFASGLGLLTVGRRKKMA
ncbi:MAG: VPLPA-CTERM sorting domain-containing protein [Methylococcaceae bacterium]